MKLSEWVHKTLNKLRGRHQSINQSINQSELNQNQSKIKWEYTRREYNRRRI